MKMKRGTLERIVREELSRHLRALSELRDDDKEEAPPSEDPTAPKGGDDRSGGPKAKPVKGNKAPAKDAPAPSQKPPADKKAGGGRPMPEPEEVPDQEDPADDEIAADADAEDEEMADDEERTGAINDAVEGKTMQALTIEPKSKILPGAKEVVVAFSDTPDPLRIIITKTGSVKFFFKGQVSDIP